MVAENLALRKRIQTQAATNPARLIPRPLKTRGVYIGMIEAVGLEEDRDLYNSIRVRPVTLTPMTVS